MTTLNEAREAIYQKFVDAWADETPFTFDNDDFDPPDEEPWARVSVRNNASTQETLGRQGNRKYARLGSAFVQIYTVGDSGTKRSDELATRAREAFEGLSLAGTTVRFLDVIVRETGPEEKWYQTVVEAEFEYTQKR